MATGASDRMTGARKSGRAVVVALAAALALAGCGRASPGRVQVPDVAVRPRATAEATWTLLATDVPSELPAVLTRRHPMRLARSAFDLDAVLADTRAIVRPGVRAGGSAEERTAAEYIVRRLKAMGFSPRVEEFGLPNGRTSRNIIIVSARFRPSPHRRRGAH